MKYFVSVLIFFLLFSLTPFVQAEPQVYFSPNGGCLDAVAKEISKAQKSIDVAMYALTSREIAQSIIRAQKKGVKIRIILDRSQISEHFSKSRYLIAQDIDVKFHLGPGLMHDKFAVIDDKVVLTGSFNWTVSAEKKNAENLLIITDRDIAQEFSKQFKVLWKQSGQGVFNEKNIGLATSPKGKAEPASE